VLNADICIVGAGAAGIALALDLINSKAKVLLLESGGFEENPQTQALYRGEVADERLHSPPDRYRQRRFGGSTTIWGGRCVPLDPIDFEARDFVPYSGWPITLEALLPYYPRANHLCEAGDFAYSASEVFIVPRRPMIDGFASMHFTTDSLERFSCPTDFGARYAHKLKRATNIRVLLYANVTSIELGPTADHVESLCVRTLCGRKFLAKARNFVLATGGLEVARLLLASCDRQPNGIGNQHDVVGRYYMCHIAGTIGELRINGPLSAVHHGYEISDDGIYCRRRLALTADAQRRFRLANFVARLHHPRIANPSHRDAVLSLLFLARKFVPYEYAKRLYGDHRVRTADWLRHIGNVASAPIDVAAFASHMLRDRLLAERKFPSIIIQSRTNCYSLDFHAEQQPNPASRVSLSSDVDALLMRRLRVDWRYTRADVGTVCRALEVLASDVQGCGIGRFEYDSASVELEMTRYGAYGGHHIGTARMGVDPRSSVVDSDCRVHGVDNLFVASSAVFPTSSQANPTLTIVALALRLGNHLKSLTAAAPFPCRPLETTDADNPGAAQATHV
jgi:choline dehydrogenase-like flavoprotein